MSEIFKRSINHLITDDYSKEVIESYLKSVEELFKADYLNSDKSLGVLPILWKRKDALATNELFALGKAIHSLKAMNGDSINEWLDSTAKTVKKQAKFHGKSEGFLREIIYCGSLFGTIGEIIPAKKAQQAYDVEIRTPNVEFVVSLKKFGKSDKHKEFENYCQKLADILKLKAAAHKKNISLTIQINTSFNEALFKSLYRAIENSSKPENINYYRGGELMMHSTTLTAAGVSPNSGSWQLNLMGPENKNEQTRFVKNIVKEITNIKKTLDNSPAHENALRMLYVNVNENCDMDLVENLLQEHYKPLDLSDDLGVDIVVLHKSAVCHGEIAEKFSKEILHDIRVLNIKTDITISNRLLRYVQNGANAVIAPLHLDGLVGSIAKIPFPIIKQGNLELDLKGFYNFQKGVYKFDMIKGKDGYSIEMSSVGPRGIIYEAIFPKEYSNDKKSYGITSKLMSEHDDLLII
ncbi:hypothetical protein NDN11_09270 [Acinetobacter sp. C26M]|uniref:hypothetical protein n=1 Tax=unclassified Acinetobacter TaxID=196816 RepID=UPI0020370D59|nr:MULTISPECIES: hypothetical protein [unclassified Acinetobacter]USA44928.1 hypothetical protein NDN11_09270 [Acinetobacter sp. C26M]USA48431.1 hypothetical protein NDN12_09270 [Acinetobacter sp. C26G]